MELNNQEYDKKIIELYKGVAEHTRFTLERIEFGNKIQCIFADLYEEIRHGDEEHQRWLKDKMQLFLYERVMILK